ncbi:putative Cytochrome P450 [Seiridium unicorne]|uniref:Cytochrome P450 n=1 Tax=Seiridium unicorne TaxID=138068 RepID=A0ABR2UXA5_9PEZI
MQRTTDGVPTSRARGVLAEHAPCNRNRRHHHHGTVLRNLKDASHNPWVFFLTFSGAFTPLTSRSTLQAPEMLFTDLSQAWESGNRLRMVLGAILALVVGRVAFFLYQGVQARLKFRRLKSQGIAILEPHSLIWGHLRVLGGVKALFPPDSQPHYSQIHIIRRWRQYFPDASECPSIIYLDLWPVQGPMALILDPAMCQELVLERNPPRHPLLKHLIKAVAGTRNLTWFDGAEHRLWRSRLNPGFSLRNLQSHMPAIIEEVQIFVRNLEATTQSAGSWGTVFPLLPRTIDLTFDVIGRVVLDLRLNEQNNGPTKLQTALRNLGSDHFFFKTLANLPKRLNPLYQLEEWRCTQELRRILVPRIKQQIGAEQSSTQKTVVQLAMKEFINETQSGKGNVSGSEFVEDVFDLTRLFLFAGHDTTATVITWAFHYLSKYPNVLEKLRAEHDDVFGSDLNSVPEALGRTPHLLNSLPYTLAVTKEVLRLSPIAATVRKGNPSFFFTGKDGIQLPTDGYALVTATAMMHYHPELWPRVNEFLPERWTVAQDDHLHPSKPGQWRPFEYGTMSCIGQELAMIEIKMVLLFTVRYLDIRPAFEEWDQLPNWMAMDFFSRTVRPRQSQDYQELGANGFKAADLPPRDCTHKIGTLEDLQ